MVTSRASSSSLSILKSVALAALLACAVLLPLLGHNRLTDWDEGIYAEVSREMLSSGWLVPHWNFGIWIDKPPLTYWITAIFFKLFGVSEFTARIGSALTAITLVGLLHGWLALRRGLLAAWLGTVMLLATFGFLHAARVGETDMMLALGSCLAVIGLAELQFHAQPPDNRGWYLYWFGFAIALMAKSAASGTIFFALVALLAVEPSLLRRVRKDFFLGFLLFLVCVLPWHLFMLHRYGMVFVQLYLGLHVFGRVAYQFDGHLTPWWYFFKVLLVSAPPFALLYPVAVYKVFREPGLRFLRPFAIFAVVDFIFFSIIQTRLPHYMLPVYGPLTAMVAVCLAEFVQSRGMADRSRGFRAGIIASGIAAWGLAALITTAPRKALHSPLLPSGVVNPNNREEVALLKQVFEHAGPDIASVPGPLLDWRALSYNPIPSVVFYSGRAVRQVSLQPVAPGTPTDIYVFDPVPLANELSGGPRLVLMDRSLIPEIPGNVHFRPIASSANLAVGILIP